MKKFCLSLLRFFVFFLVWALIIGLLGDMIPSISNPAVQRFVDELMPLLVLMIVTFAFSSLLDKNKYKTVIFGKLPKNIFWGIGIGILWFGIAFLVQYLGGWAIVQFDSSIPFLFIYILALLVNTCMQEFLVRGYLFNMLEKRHNKIVATIFTTALFTFLHGGAFEAGVIAVANVITMSIFVTFLMFYTESLLTPILVHFLWNFLGGVIFNSVSLPYPSIFSVLPVGNILFSGGEYKLENSVITLVINSILVGVFFLCYSKKANPQNMKAM